MTTGYLRMIHEQRVRLLCMRLADMVRVHPRMDTTHRCARCKHTVGLYPSGQDVLRKHRNNVEIVCQQCMTGDEGKDAGPAPGAVQEVTESTWRN